MRQPQVDVAVLGKGGEDGDVRGGQPGETEDRQAPRQRGDLRIGVQQADPAKLALGFPKLAAAAKDNLGTDIPQQELEAWVTLAMRIKSAKVKSLTFDEKVIPNRADPDFDPDLCRRWIRPQHHGRHRGFPAGQDQSRRGAADQRRSPCGRPGRR